MTLPAPPPGYVYTAVLQPLYAPWQQPAVVTDPARREELYNQLNRVNLRIDRVEHTRISVGGPITMMVLSYGTALISTAIALGNLGAAEEIENGTAFDEARDFDANNDGEVDDRDERRFRRAARISAAVAGGSLVLGLLSTARLASRVGERREQRAELQTMRQRRDNLRRQLDFGAGAGPGNVQLQIQGRY